MDPLVKIRSERDQMSAVERRIADYLLENAQLLRDYSSQQLANALGISQSSVVKFSQKLGFKGYPDLKYSVGEAIARANNGAPDTSPDTRGDDADVALAERLWRHKTEAEQATRLINPPEDLEAVAAAIGHAGDQGKVFLIGLGEDDVHARSFAMKLALLGILTVHNFDAARMTANTSTAGRDDVLLVFSEYGQHPALCKISRWFRQNGGKVVTVTRHTSNPLRTLGDMALLVSAHHEAPYIASMLYQSALEQLLDCVFVLLCENDADRHGQLLANIERIQLMQEP
ncbi:MAG: MurR/RpiR family transcriptional regulator [Rhodanobacteraceae bacterium]